MVSIEITPVCWLNSRPPYHAALCVPLPPIPSPSLRASVSILPGLSAKIPTPLIPPICSPVHRQRSPAPPLSPVCSHFCRWVSPTSPLSQLFFTPSLPPLYSGFPRFAGEYLSSPRPPQYIPRLFNECPYPLFPVYYQVHRWRSPHFLPLQPCIHWQRSLSPYPVEPQVCQQRSPIP